MRHIRYLLLVGVLLSAFLPNAYGFHVPPWDAGHQSFDPNDPDGDQDLGDDGPCKSGSPVEVSSRNFTYNVTDLAIAGLGPAIQIVRTYNSRDMRNGPFGIGWVFA